MLRHYMDSLSFHLTGRVVSEPELTISDPYSRKQFVNSGRTFLNLKP